eukprot:1148183-Pelagomonas_calceolata.AAC.4
MQMPNTRKRIECKRPRGCISNAASSGGADAANEDDLLCTVCWHDYQVKSGTRITSPCWHSYQLASGKRSADVASEDDLLCTVCWHDDQMRKGKGYIAVPAYVGSLAEAKTAPDFM